MTQSTGERLAQWVEQWPAYSPGLLIALGLVLGTFDVHWSLAHSGRGGAAYRAGGDFERAPVVVSKVSEPEAKAVAPVAAPEAVAATVTALPADCPPFFAIRFALGSAVPRFEQEQLVEFVRWLNQHPQAILVVDGHSDAQGSSAVNLGLSRQRADQVVKQFAAAGLPRNRMTRRAFGDFIPIVGSPETSAENRRVVLSIAGQKGCSQLESP